MKFIPNILASQYWKGWGIGVVMILSLALSLYLPKFGQLPAGLNRDEAALGYNAYSLLETGKDEWGTAWPVSITSFGDQKLPGYIYTLIPFIAIFGLKIWVIRLPSLLAGLVVIVGTGLIAMKLAKQTKLSLTMQLTSCFLVMILTAISPWNMHFSRVAYETHLALAMFISSLACLLFALDTNHKLRQRILLVTAALLSGLTLLTYHSYQVFIPLFFLAFLGLNFKKIKKLDQTGIKIGLAIGLVSVGLLIGGGVFKANLIKSQGINPLDNQTLLNKATEYRTLKLLPAINKVLFNKYNEGIITFTQNYTSTFSGTFFFIHGSNHGDHNPGNGGSINLFLAPFVLLGLLAMGRYHQKKSIQLVAIWLMIGLIPSSLTINPLLEVRLGTIFPALEILAVIGIFYLFHFLSRLQKHILGISLLAVGLLSATRMFIFYTQIAPPVSVDNTGYHLLAQTLYRYRSAPETVLTQSPFSSPYIWYLFENKIDPSLVHQKIIHYPTTDEGFIHVKQLENVHFETISWDGLGTIPYILILKPTEISPDQRVSPSFSLIETITDANNQVLYEVWRYHLKPVPKY